VSEYAAEGACAAAYEHTEVNTYHAERAMELINRPDAWFRFTPTIAVGAREGTKWRVHAKEASREGTAFIESASVRILERDGNRSSGEEGWSSLAGREEKKIAACTPPALRPKTHTSPFSIWQTSRREGEN